MPIIEVLTWNAPPRVFAYRYPNCQLTTKSQLIVQQSQEAVLVKEGQFIGPFEAGRHVLDTKNYPVLTQFVSTFVSGGLSPYTAEVWFVNLAIPLDIKWGTSDPIQLEDPKYHIMLPVRAFGQYGIQIDDSLRFLEKLVGRLPAFTEKTLSDYFRGFMLTRVKDCVAKYLVDKDFSILQIASRLSEISEVVEKSFAEDIENYGVKLVSFRVNSITTDERDPAVQRLKNALSKKAEMSILGYTYQQERSFDVMDHAASNEGSGTAGTMVGTGVGLGVGLGIGERLRNAASSVGGALFGAPAQPVQPATIATGVPVSIVPPIPTAVSAVSCPNCGTALAPGAKFCSNCGCNLHPATTVQQKGCPSCGHPVSVGMKFCPECGTAVERKCASCGADLPAGFRFCPSCGTKA